MSLDGRDARWEDHRRERRRELLESALRTIRDHGAGVGMDEIAAGAATSKSILYRHFGDRTGLYLAVVESVADYIVGAITPVIESAAEPAALVADLTRVYLDVVARDPNIYRFVLNRPHLPEGDDPLNGVSERVAAEVTPALARSLADAGADAAMAPTWGSGLVGFVRAVANTWLGDPGRRSREDVVDDVAHLFEQAFPVAAKEPA